MDKNNTENLPIVAETFIDVVIKKMRYKKKVRNEVRQELVAHFADALRSCQTDEEKTSVAKEMITDFGDPKILAILITRGKKRNRPLWKKVIIRSLKAFGIFIVLFFLYSLWFISGKPAISTDYVNVLNEMGKPDVIEGHNAWVDYDKAIALYIEPEDKVKEITDDLNMNKIKIQLKELTDEQREIFTNWLDSNKPAWDHFAAGSQKPYAYRQYGYGDYDESVDEPWLVHILLPHLGDIRNVSKLGAWSAIVDAEQGDLKQALEKCLALTKSGKHLKRNIILIEQLIGIAIQAIGYGALTEIISEEQVPADLLDKVNEELTSMYSTGYPMSNMEGERLFFLDSVQRIYTNTGPGGGHIIPGRITSLMMDLGQDEEDIAILKILAVPVCTVMAGRDNVLKKGNELYDYLNTLTNYTPYQRKTDNIRGMDDLLKELSFRYTLIRMILPAIEKVIDLNYRSKAHHEAMLTTLAALRYQSQKGTLPDNLDQLVRAGYLVSVPDDPYGPGSLIYKKTDDEFTLYSVGDNMIDDGGKYGTDKQGEKRKWADNGDMVFWPAN